MSRLGKLFSLPMRDQWLLVKAGATVVVVRAALWVVPFRYLRPRFERDARQPDDAAQGPRVARVTWAVSNVSRLVPMATCLTQAMSVRWLLKRQGIGCALRIGVKRDAAGAFQAHAWIEHAGHVVIGGQGNLGEFAALPAI